MSWKATIMMCLLAAIATVCAWLLRADSTPGSAAHEARPLVDRADLARDRIEKISIVDEDGRASVYARVDAGWSLVEPFRHPVRTSSMHGLIDAALLTEVVDSIPYSDDQELDRYRLGPPRSTIRFEGGAGPLEVNLGRTGIGGRGYLQRAGEDAILVTNGSLHKSLFSTDPVQWRDRALFPGMDIEVDRISRTIDGNDIIIEREGRTWSMTSPINTRIDQEAIGSHVMDLAQSEWNDVLLEQPVDLEAFGLASPKATIRILRSGESRVLLIGERLGGDTQDRSAMVEGIPVVLRVSGETMSSILSDPATLIDHTASGILPPDIKRIVIETPLETIVLERTLDEWTAPEHGDQAVPSRAVDQLLDALTSLRATDVELKDIYPQELERATVTFHGFDGRPMDTVRLLRETGDAGRWGMENGDRVIRIHPEFLFLPLSSVDYGLPVPAPDPVP